jgi:hypothetical protein
MSATLLEEQIRSLWDAVRQNRAMGRDLLLFLKRHPSFLAPCAHTLPLLHRICDVRLDGEPHRLLRCFECRERLSFEPISESVFREEEGVPYALTGSSLERWVRDEQSSPTEWETDWSQYLGERQA